MLLLLGHLGLGCCVALTQNDPVNVLMIGAHPDDCEVGAGGLAILYAQLGHRVKFV